MPLFSLLSGEEVLFEATALLLSFFSTTLAHSSRVLVLNAHHLVPAEGVKLTCPRLLVAPALGLFLGLVVWRLLYLLVACCNLLLTPLGTSEGTSEGGCCALHLV